MNDANHDRVAYYGRNDFFTDRCRDRCVEMLAKSETYTIVAVNDAIEAHQCKLMVDNIPELFEGMPSLDPEESAKQLFTSACKYINRLLSSVGVDEVYEQVEFQYAEQFWSLVEASGTIARIQSADLGKLISLHPGCIRFVLRRKRLVNEFSEVIKQSLRHHADISAELIIDQFATDSGRRGNLYLPPTLGSSEIDCIMLDYISSDKANLNYVLALRDWPSRFSGDYNPSPEVRVRAKRMYESSVEQLFANGAGLQFVTGVAFDRNQLACKSLKVDGYNVTYIFGRQWLEKYTDPATIMNNLRYVFDFIDANGLMFAPVSICPF